MKKDKPTERRELRETIPYKQFCEYQESFLFAANVCKTVNEARSFYYGKQYVDGYASDTPKPVMNLCKEGVDKIAAKLTGTKRHISFVCDKPDEDLTKMDRFYEFQTGLMDDDEFIDDLTKAALIDGAGVAWTAYDRDTLKSQGIYEGFLKRKIIPFEQCFFSDPYEADPQEQRYCGYYFDMDVAAAKKLIEGDEETVKAKEPLIVSENYYVANPPLDISKRKDGDTVRVYTRFFRVEGEVFFEVATQYCYLTERPHALNPRYNDERKFLKLLRSMDKKYINGKKGDYSVIDYDVDPERYLIFEKAVKEEAEKRRKRKSAFSRYPVTIFRPYPVLDCVIGQSFVSMIIPNQKLINYFYLLSALITQNHAMPKILVKPSAMKNQVYDTSPNQILVDYSTLQENGGAGWGITRMGAGDAVNNTLIAQADNLIERTRQVYGFANLEGSNFSSDTSGYAYSQMVKQTNLVLEVPQKKLWLAVKENARTDLMYFRHYVDNARFYTRKDPEEIALNEDYRRMTQAMIDAGKAPSFKPGTQLEPTKGTEWTELGAEFFDADFTIDMDVEQGIAGSELTESQHINQIWGYIAQGNIPANMLKILLNADPAISNKTRSKMMTSIEELELSQINQLKAQIDQLKQTIANMNTYVQYEKNLRKATLAQQKATEKAAQEQSQVAYQMLKDKDRQIAEVQPVNQMSESEVKSLNAKGISGGSFSKGGPESIYNS